MKKIKLAIIMPTGNRKELIEQTERTLRKSLEEVDFTIFTMNGMEVGEINAVNELSKCVTDEYEYILRTDDDMYYLRGWFNIAVKLLEKYPLVGGCYYPLHKIIKETEHYYITEIAPGNCWLMKKKTWDEFSPIRKSVVQEDVDFCWRIQKTGQEVVCLKEPLVIHCGITNSKGRGRGELVTKYMLKLINKVGAKYV